MGRPQRTASYALVTPSFRPALAEDLDHLECRPAVYAWAYRSSEFGVGNPVRLDVVVGYLRSLANVIARPPKVMEVAEPMWLRAWPSTVVFVMLTRFAALVRGKRIRVLTYAIENLSPMDSIATRKIAGCRLGGTGARTVTRILQATARVTLDAIIFGSPEAADNYAHAMPKLISRITSETVLPSLGRCHICFPPGSPLQAVPARREVVFVGELGERKGTDTLLRAWPSVKVKHPDWSLRLLGHGPMLSLAEREARTESSITVEANPSRQAVHDALREAAVVVLPSRRVPGWREQQGLPILEGISHGCHVVASSETGLAKPLAEEGHLIVSPDSPGELSQAINLAVARYSALKTPPPASTPTTRQRLITIAEDTW